jgi:hypothetical protein
MGAGSQHQVRGHLWLAHKTIDVLTFIDPEVERISHTGREYGEYEQETACDPKAVLHDRHIIAMS